MRRKRIDVTSLSVIVEVVERLKDEGIISSRITAEELANHFSLKGKPITANSYTTTKSKLRSETENYNSAYTVINTLELQKLRKHETDYKGSLGYSIKKKDTVIITQQEYFSLKEQEQKSKDLIIENAKLKGSVETTEKTLELMIGEIKQSVAVNELKQAKQQIATHVKQRNKPQK